MNSTYCTTVQEAIEAGWLTPYEGGPAINAYRGRIYGKKHNNHRIFRCTKPAIDQILIRPVVKTPLVVVRVKTRYYRDDRSIIQKKELTYFKKPSFNCGLLMDHAANTGEECVIKSITNWNTIPDGIYEVQLSDIAYDGEHMDTWNYKLIPYTGSLLNNATTRAAKPK